MNTEPVKAMATQDKHEITWNDVWMALSPGQRVSLEIIGCIFGISAVIGVGISLAFYPIETIFGCICVGAVYVIAVLLIAYKKVVDGK